jgi:nucleoside-diphosphate-sugar epimerase
MSSKFKTLLIIGGTGFFAKSILDYIFCYCLSKNINKILLISRGHNKIKINQKLRKKIKIVNIYGDISKLKKIPFADYVIYCAINHNYNQDYKAVCNYYKLAKMYHYKSKILYTSSGAVYGQQPKNIKKIKENYLLVKKKIKFQSNSKNIYSNSKLKNEKIFQKLGKLGINVSIARCFAFVGKHLPRNKGYAVGNFIDNIIKNKIIKINSSHDVVRSYMYADDLARWLFKIVFSANDKCPIYNVGSDLEISIFKLADFLSKKYNLSLIFKNIDDNFIDRYIPNINKAKNKLQLSNKYDNLAGVIKTIELLKHEKNH